MKAVAEVESADQFCHHLCPNPACGHVFPDVPRKDWPTVAEQCYPQCRQRVSSTLQVDWFLRNGVIMHATHAQAPRRLMFSIVSVGSVVERHTAHVLMRMPASNELHLH